ncbi:MAG: hypothetical protein ACAI44_02620 [Candidatus Sericytochromatia bacterium]
MIYDGSYYTEFSLTIEGAVPADKLKLATELAQISRNSLQDMSRLVNGDKVYIQWHSSLKDLAIFSKAHPELMLILKGEGEDEFDRWTRTFRMGIDLMPVEEDEYEDDDEADLE